MDIVIQITQHYKIIYLELNGIGTSKSLSWPGQILRVDLNRKELTQLFSYLQPEATIATLGCQNGSGLIDYFSQLAPSHLIIGHTGTDLEQLNIKVGSLKPLVITCHRYNVDITKTKVNAR